MRAERPQKNNNERTIKMKKQRILSLILAATMVMGAFSLTAFAANDEDTLKGPDEEVAAEEEEGEEEKGEEEEQAPVSGSTNTIPGRVADSEGLTELPFDKALTIAEGGSISDVTFTFEMTPATVQDGTKDTANNTVKSGIGDTLTAEIEFNAADTSDTDIAETDADTSTTTVTKEVTFDLEDLDFSDAGQGVYRYEVTEVTGDDEEYTYDTTKYIVDLYVDADGNITAIQAYKGTDKAPIVFTNHCKTADLIIKKYIEGDQADPNQEFTFYIKVPVDGDALNLASGQELTAKKFDKDGKELTGSDDKVVIKVAGTKAASSEAWSEFTLKGGEYVVIYGVPEGMIYWVKEADYSGDGYKTYNTVVTGTNQESGASYGTTVSRETDQRTIVKDNNIVLFKNEKDVPNTGISVDVIPYVLVVMAALCGAALFINKKRNAVR
jgi:pilin isopeptide linkage protein